MASFPGSVKSFAVRSNGQTIADTWFNDPDDEITAIEDGLRNGTAPLNSSNSTFTAINVTGKSTLAGAVNQGDSTLSSLTVTNSALFSSLVTAPAQPRAHVFASGVQAFAASTTTLVTFDSEVFDVGALHSTSVNPSRITIPAGSSGLYWCHGQVYALAIAAGVQSWVVYLQRNSSKEIAMQRLVSTGSHEMVQVSGLLVLDGGDFVELSVLTQASTLSAGNVTAFAANRFQVAKLW